jgi:hypothetical protein
MTRGATDFLWEINGTEGDIQVTAFSGNAQVFELAIRGASKDERVLQASPVPDRYRNVPLNSPYQRSM